jgi:hypothetical protein
MVRILKGIAVFGILSAAACAATWQIDTVDVSGPAKFSSLKIDAQGNAHLAYVVDDGNNSLKYAFWDHRLNRWFVLPIATRASFCSLALDSLQHPQISWADSGTGEGAKLRYAFWDGQSWQKVEIPLNSEIIGYYTSIALDSKDRPNISFYEYRGPRETDFKIRLRTVRRNGTQWELKTLDPQEGSGKFNSIAVDAHDEIHIAYANVSAGTAGLRYAHTIGGVWRSEVVEGQEENNGESVGFSTCLALDRDGVPHIAYVNESSGLIKYAYRKDGRWTIQSVEQIAAVGYPDRNSIALTDQGRPYIGYFDAGRGLLSVAHQEGSKWVAERIDRNGAGFNSSMQIQGGRLWISYAGERGFGVKVARRELTELASAVPGVSVAVPKQVQDGRR